ncbi:hypothetical protein GBAR_LOCUS10484 [Geodia barretti]|uniref:Fibronectin type-III domain-containing protein n=1 Tax=Geodia barretti TaxID=519541 RepID=A0AA35WK00_GEOBA|nr:hypothetical protein GBAR_LOCUS10484 [Geodia barretti]
MVCPNDPLLFTCTVTDSPSPAARVILPSGEGVLLTITNMTQVIGATSLPDGVTEQSHNAIGDGPVNYTLALAIERASLLGGNPVICDAATAPALTDEASCPIATDPPGPPESLSQVVSANTEISAVVQWESPAMTGGGTGVTISEYRVTVDGGVTQTVSHDDSRDVFTAHYCTQFNTSYSVSVTAINSCGLSSQPATITVFIEARVPPQPTVQSLVMYYDVPLSGGRPVVLNWTEGEREVGVVYPGEEMTTVDLTPGGTICSFLSTPIISCTATITNDCSNYNISITLSNDIGPSQPVSIIFNSAPVEVEEGESPAGGPAVIVSLNPLCRSVPYTVGLSFGVRENSGETFLPQQNVTANILPGTPVILPINVTTLPLADGQEYCFTVPQLNIEGGM